MRLVIIITGFIYVRCGVSIRAYKKCGVHWNSIPLLLRSKSILQWCWDSPAVYDAFEQIKKTEKLFPERAGVHGMLSDVYERKGMYEEAIREFQKEKTLRGIDPTLVQEKADEIRTAYNKSGPEGYYQKWLELALQEIKQPSFFGFTPGHLEVAALYAMLNKNDEAFAELESAFQEGGPQLIALYVSPDFDNLRDVARYDQFLKLLRLKVVD